MGQRDGRNTKGYRLGWCYYDDRKYPTLNPPRREPKATRRAPAVEADVTYGPFIIRCMYRTSDRAFDRQPPCRLGYMLIHRDSDAAWSEYVFRRVENARAFALRVAESFNVAPWGAVELACELAS